MRGCHRSDVLRVLVRAPIGGRRCIANANLRIGEVALAALLGTWSRAICTPLRLPQGRPASVPAVFDILPAFIRRGAPVVVVVGKLRDQHGAAIIETIVVGAQFPLRGVDLSGACVHVDRQHIYMAASDAHVLLDVLARRNKPIRDDQVVGHPVVILIVVRVNRCRDLVVEGVGDDMHEVGCVIFGQMGAQVQVTDIGAAVVLGVVQRIHNLVQKAVRQDFVGEWLVRIAKALSWNVSAGIDLVLYKIPDGEGLDQRIRILLVVPARDTEVGVVEIPEADGGGRRGTLRVAARHAARGQTFIAGLHRRGKGTFRRCCHTVSLRDTGLNGGLVLPAQNQPTQPLPSIPFVIGAIESLVGVEPEELVADASTDKVRSAFQALLAVPHVWVLILFEHQIGDLVTAFGKGISSVLRIVEDIREAVEEPAEGGVTLLRIPVIGIPALAKGPRALGIGGGESGHREPGHVTPAALLRLGRVEPREHLEVVPEEPILEAGPVNAAGVSTWAVDRHVDTLEPGKIAIDDAVARGIPLAELRQAVEVGDFGPVPGPARDLLASFLVRGETVLNQCVDHRSVHRDIRGVQAVQTGRGKRIALLIDQLPTRIVDPVVMEFKTVEARRPFDDLCPGRRYAALN